MKIVGKLLHFFAQLSNYNICKLLFDRAEEIIYIITTCLMLLLPTGGAYLNQPFIYLF